MQFSASLKDASICCYFAMESNTSLYFCQLTSKSADTDNNVITFVLMHYRAQQYQSRWFWWLLQISCYLDGECTSLIGRISQKGFRNAVCSRDLHSVMSAFFLLFLIFSFFSKCQKSYKMEGEELKCCVPFEIILEQLTLALINL